MRFWNHEILVILKQEPSKKNPGFSAEIIYQYLPHKYTKRKKTRTCFCTFQERSSCVDTRCTNVRHIWSGRQVVQFLRLIFWKTKVDLSKKYTTFINSSWVIFERNMRVVIFNSWSACAARVIVGCGEMCPSMGCKHYANDGRSRLTFKLLFIFN